MCLCVLLSGCMVIGEIASIEWEWVSEGCWVLGSLNVGAVIWAQRTVQWVKQKRARVCTVTRSGMPIASNGLGKCSSSSSFFQNDLIRRIFKAHTHSQAQAQKRTSKIVGVRFFLAAASAAVAVCFSLFLCSKLEQFTLISCCLIIRCSAVQCNRKWQVKVGEGGERKEKGNVLCTRAPTHTHSERIITAYYSLSLSLSLSSFFFSGRQMGAWASTWLAFLPVCLLVCSLCS